MNTGTLTFFQHIYYAFIQERQNTCGVPSLISSENAQLIVDEHNKYRSQETTASNMNKMVGDENRQNSGLGLYIGEIYNRKIKKKNFMMHLF